MRSFDVDLHLDPLFLSVYGALREASTQFFSVRILYVVLKRLYTVVEQWWEQWWVLVVVSQWWRTSGGEAVVGQWWGQWWCDQCCGDQW